MEHLRTKITMANPSQPSWADVLKFIEDITPWAGVFALLWKAIDKVFKYFSDRAEERLRKIVHEEMSPEISNLSEKISNLSEAIFQLKNRI